MGVWLVATGQHTPREGGGDPCVGGHRQGKARGRSRQQSAADGSGLVGSEGAAVDVGAAEGHRPKSANRMIVDGKFVKGHEPTGAESAVASGGWRRAGNQRALSAQPST